MATRYIIATHSESVTQKWFFYRMNEVVTAGGGTGIVEMLFCTSLVALVAVKLNRRRLIVVLEQTIFIYDISNMKLLHTIDTSPNPNGDYLSAICALSPSNENCYIAYPSPVPSPSSPFSNHSTQHTAPSGDVLIFDALSLQVVNVVQAHKSPVAYVAINSEGTLLATASDKGTVIRVFSIPNAQKLHQFRRGSYPARIHSISFNLVSSLLCVSSDTETVHVFKLVGNTGGPNSNTNANNGATNGAGGVANSLARHSIGPTTIGGFEAFIDGKKKTGSVGAIRRQSLHLGRTVAGSVGNYLPDALTEMWEPTRDFAYLKLPSSGVQSVVALSNTTPQVMVVTSEGYFYQYNIDLENGGECVLLKQYSLLEPNEDLGTPLIPE
ncbi:5293_t:CDS:2 [Cetraspora pellucida]|uniref:5293_t:CDS:1 n=1 Tax=Cetraspora pellucida TaxID=1433469 RepID=A0A9N9D0Q8_9GLOM|nr:5293_t:CDS:2 [Cetraspora pellucida]